MSDAAAAHAPSTKPNIRIADIRRMENIRRISAIRISRRDTQRKVKGRAKLVKWVKGKVRVCIHGTEAPLDQEKKND